jgi:hypothetical protein
MDEAKLGQFSERKIEHPIELGVKNAFLLLV